MTAFLLGVSFAEFQLKKIKPKQLPTCFSVSNENVLISGHNLFETSICQTALNRQRVLYDRPTMGTRNMTLGWKSWEL